MKYILAILILLHSLGVSAQSKDSLAASTFNSSEKKDTVASSLNKVRNSSLLSSSISNSIIANKDSIPKTAVVLPPTPKKLLEVSMENDAVQHKYSGKNIVKLLFPEWLRENKKQGASNVRLHVLTNQNDDLLFYTFLGLLTLFGIIRTWFPKYSKQITHFLIQPNLRRKQSKESANINNILPSVLFNFLFVISSSLFIGQLIKKQTRETSFWSICLYSAIAITLIYLIKYIVIKLSGWLFNAPAAASTYNYVVFSINKIIGILLIPLTILIAYSGSNDTSSLYTLTGIMIACLFLYRYISSFILIRGSLNVTAFHFFLYLCAVEIIPLLIVYKVIIINHSGYIYN